MMRRLLPSMVLACVVLLLCSTVRGAEIRSAAVTVTVKKDGCGFIDAIRFKGRTVVKARDGFAGGAVTIAKAGTGTLESLFPNTAAAGLQARLSGVKALGQTLVMEGAYSHGTVSVPFSRRIALGADGRTITVREEVDYARLDEAYVVAGHALDLPLVVGKDEHLRMLALGGQTRTEMFRMDMNDESRRNQNLSDNRAFRPYWDIGGVLQRARSYEIWRANHADTMAYPIESGEQAPGWADYSELHWGLTVTMLRAGESAPWAMTIDARRGVFSIAPWPAGHIPIAGKDLSKRTFEFTIALHETSWPTTAQCELDIDVYKRLLDYLNRGERYTHLDYVCDRLGLVVRYGRKTPQQMEDVYRRIILKERIQPSVLMRLLYRGDAWRMQGLMRDVVGTRVPRNQPIEQWERDARLFFAKIRTDGLPKRP